MARIPRYESPGEIDFPWDTDPRSGNELPSDVTCTVPWRADGFEAIEVFVDPALSDRVDEICSGITAIAGAHEDIDGLAWEIGRFASDGGLSVGVYEDPPDEVSVGVVAVALTIG